MKYLLAGLFFLLGCSGHIHEAAPPVAMQKKKIRFIINPCSGHGRSHQLAARISRKFHPKDYEYDIYLTKGRGDATLLAQNAAEQGYDIVVAVGGDGTVHEVGKALINTSTALAIIPRGSGNGFAGSLKIPSQVDAALKILARGHLLNIDTMTINETPFLGIAGTGFDALIGDKFAALDKRGPAGYVKLINEEYKDYKPEHYSLEIDGEPYETDAFMIAFANTNQYGNNLQIDPLAKVDDGNFELVMVDEFPQWAIPELVLRLFGGQINNSSYTETKSCKQVTLKGKEHLVHLDGEPHHFQGDLEIKIHPHTLNVVVP
jgi:YegS/Rv2252/BmrU family lipid kinase